MYCYYCWRPVPEAEHRLVKKFVDWCMMDVNTFDNSFIHMTGATPENLDSDGNVVVCSEDCIRDSIE